MSWNIPKIENERRVGLQSARSTSAHNRALPVDMCGWTRKCKNASVGSSWKPARRVARTSVLGVEVSWAKDLTRQMERALDAFVERDQVTGNALFIAIMHDLVKRNYRTFPLTMNSPQRSNFDFNRTTSRDKIASMGRPWLPSGAILIPGPIPSHWRTIGPLRRVAAGGVGGGQRAQGQQSVHSTKMQVPGRLDRHHRVAPPQSRISAKPRKRLPSSGAACGRPRI